MNKKLHEILGELSSALHWLGKYSESGDLNAISAFLQKHNIYYEDQLEDWNMPCVVEWAEELAELKTIIEQAAESDVDGCYSIIAECYRKMEG